MSQSLLPPDSIQTISIEQEMRQSYLDYAMSVIVSRALPDVRDGLKPVHRRIIYAMNEGDYTYQRPFRKSARIVGDVMGKYHPHGDSSIYDAMVRMAQSFSLRLPLIFGQGNFGSMDGDSAAAMRYTEAKMALSAHALIDDIDKNTVDFRPNYDDSLLEPEVLPAGYPNLLVNGANGIAVGMATNIPPHNLGELIDACCALVDSPQLTVDDLLAYVQGPDFPTGAKILGRGGILSALRTGRGSLSIRGVATVEEIKGGRSAVVITEVPWQVNKARMVEEIAEIKDRDDKKIDAIAAVRDESDRHGVRVVVEVKRDVDPELVLNQLYKYTSLQTSFGVNMLAIHKGYPKQMNVLEMLNAFLAFREDVIRRRTLYLLDKARDRAHILAGLGVAVDNLDAVVRLIRASKDTASARIALMAERWAANHIAPYIALLDDHNHQVVDGLYQLSERQANAILDLRLHRLTALERDKILQDLEAIAQEIRHYLSLLADRASLLALMKTELMDIKARFSTPRRTQIEDVVGEMEEEDFIPKKDFVVTISRNGYVKRVPLDTYRLQRRGGKGRSGMDVREGDYVAQVFIIHSHQSILFFSSMGMAYKMKCYRLPEGSPTSFGRSLMNLLPLKPSETITTVLPLDRDGLQRDIVFATKNGTIRRNDLQDFDSVQSNGKIAMKLDGDDSLIGVRLYAPDEDIILHTHLGKVIRFPLDTLRIFASRSSVGVRAIKLASADYVIGLAGVRHEKIADTQQRDAYLRYATAKRGDRLDSLEPSGLSSEALGDFAQKEEFILTVTSRGYGKISSAYEYRITNRGGSGITGIDLTAKNGDVIDAFPVSLDDELILVSNKGQLIRVPVATIRIASRRTQGVILFKIDADERVVSVGRLAQFKVDDDPVESVDSLTPSDELF